jgi:hypothetical protein
MKYVAVQGFVGLAPVPILWQKMLKSHRHKFIGFIYLTHNLMQYVCLSTVFKVSRIHICLLSTNDNNGVGHAME